MNSCSPPTQPIDSTRLCARFSSTEPRQQRRPSGSATHPGVFASCAMSSAKTLSESSFCHKRRRPSCRRPGRDFVRRSSPCASRTRRCTTSGMPWIRVGKSSLGRVVAGRSSSRRLGRRANPSSLRIVEIEAGLSCGRGRRRKARPVRAHVPNEGGRPVPVPSVPCQDPSRQDAGRCQVPKARR